MYLMTLNLVQRIAEALPTAGFGALSALLCLKLIRRKQYRRHWRVVDQTRTDKTGNDEITGLEGG
jgi:hypothetical protein